MSEEDPRLTIVIGHRLGKGQEVARGIEDAGVRAVLIPGTAGDMRVGDVMAEEKAELGISFCGSGGAGAVTAKSKYGHEIEFGMRSVDAGVTAVQTGKTVLGFGFLDTHELGQRIATELARREGRA